MQDKEQFASPLIVEEFKTLAIFNFIIHMETMTPQAIAEIMSP